METISAANKFLQIRPDDKVLVALQDLPKGQTTSWQDGVFTLQDDIAAEYCIKASGEMIPKAVQLNQRDFIPWKRGVSL